TDVCPLRQRRSHRLGAWLRRSQSVRQLVATVGGLRNAERRRLEDTVARAAVLLARHALERWTVGDGPDQRCLALLARSRHRATADAGAQVRNRRRLLRRLARRLDQPLSGRRALRRPRLPVVAGSAGRLDSRRPRRRLSLV